jgi:serine/threonine-protein kinase RsbT
MPDPLNPTPAIPEAETLAAIEVSIQSEGDIVVARRAVREAAGKMGFGTTDTTRIVTGASELARNIYRYACPGVMRLRPVDLNGRVGLELQFEDHGPGIPDVDRGLREGFANTGGLGLGLRGTKRLMDEMQIESDIGKGTTITVRKWRPN